MYYPPSWHYSPHWHIPISFKIKIPGCLNSVLPYKRLVRFNSNISFYCFYILHFLLLKHCQHPKHNLVKLFLLNQSNTPLFFYLNFSFCYHDYLGLLLSWVAILQATRMSPYLGGAHGIVCKKIKEDLYMPHNMMAHKPSGLQILQILSQLRNVRKKILEAQDVHFKSSCCCC